MRELKNFINGDFVDTNLHDAFDVINSANRGGDSFLTCFYKS